MTCSDDNYRRHYKSSSRIIQLSSFTTTFSTYTFLAQINVGLILMRLV